MAPCERAVKTLKQICYHLCFLYRTLKLENIIGLTEKVYNHKAHQGLGGELSPHQVHMDTHNTALVSKLNAITHQKHKLDAMGLQSKIPKKDMLKINDKVKYLVKRSTFRKIRPLKRSIWSDEVCRIVDIDTSLFPAMYTIENHRNKFYAWELLRVGSFYPLEENRAHQSKILVDSYKLQSSPFLRSGRQKEQFDQPIYTILRNGERSTATRNELESLKKELGKDVLLYSSFFNKSPHRQYIV